MKKYDLYPICSVLLLVVLLKQHPSKAQQPYVNDKQFNCGQDLNITNGFKCNGAETSCQSYLTFRSTPPYDSPLSIGLLLHADFSFIAEINNITISQEIPTDTKTIIPIDCSCLGHYYQHNSSHQVRPSDSYFSMANDTFQGLTTCQAMKRENPYTVETLSVGVKVRVPLRCACPTSNQTASGFMYLLAYITTSGDNISTIADLFGADKQSILDANELSEDSIIYPFTALVVPLKSKPTGERKKKQKMLLMELGGNEITFNVHDKVKKQSKYGQDGLQTFSFKSIYDATSNFSTENKLGVGGFGPVYKAWQLWNAGKGIEFTEPTILDESFIPSEVLRCIHVGLLCVQDQATDRPTMLDVVSFLANETIQLSTPKQPAFFINTITKDLDVSKNKSKNYSVNNVTISKLDAR
uniref:LysM domain-containing protein n=1 Tax=Quercus lobata TaxID=97700 RepID=A0A7N2LM98_QUELO